MECQALDTSFHLCHEKALGLSVCIGVGVRVGREWRERVWGIFDWEICRKSMKMML